MCGGIVNDDFGAYLLVNLLSKKMKIGQHLAKFSGLFFLTHGVHQ